MACIQVLVGQCGTQLGSEFLHDIAKEAAASETEPSYQSQISDRFFRPPETRNEVQSSNDDNLPVARSVLVDMEPKAIDSCAERAATEGLFSFSPRTAVVKDEGSANNWAFGFHVQGPSKREEILEGIRQEVELADATSSIHVTHSAAGGTGSGVGSYISQLARDEFPSKMLMHNLVWPFTQGEMTTQWYNATHVVQQLHENADAIHFLSNDEALGAPAVGTRPKLEDVNFAMSSILTSLHLPSYIAEVPPPQTLVKRSRLLEGGGGGAKSSAAGQTTISYEPQQYGSTSAFDMVEALALNPRRKFFEGFCSPKPQLVNSGAGGHTTVTLAHTTATSWQSVIQDPLRHVLGTIPNDLLSHTSLLVLRGKNAFAEGTIELQGGLRTLFSSTAAPLAARGGGAAVATKVEPRYLDGLCTSQASFRQLTHHASVFATRRKLGSVFHQAAEKCEAMVAAGAFVHHYSRYGTEVSDFEDAILTLYSLAESYQRQPSMK